MNINLSTQAGVNSLQKLLNVVQNCDGNIVDAVSIKETSEALTKRFLRDADAVVGTRVVVDLGAKDYPRRRIPPYSTHVTMEWVSPGHWIVTDVYRAQCSPASQKVYVTRRKEE